MDKKTMIAAYWRDVAEQNAAGLRGYFSKDTSVRWHNTNELFTLDEYIIANCEYPGTWVGDLERMMETGDTVVTVVRVHDPDDTVSVHATSFFRFEDDKIVELDEYWGDDGKVPHWRLDKKIGKPIK